MPTRLQQHRQDMTQPMGKGVSRRVEHGAPIVSGGTRHALLAEQIRIRHIRKALVCATDGLFRERCEAELASSIERALHLECKLRAAADSAEHDQGHSTALRLGECLLSAIDMARANGDVSAAEAVAQECLALVELHCRTLLDSQFSGTAAAALEQVTFSNGAVES